MIQKKCHVVFYSISLAHSLSRSLSLSILTDVGYVVFYTTGLSAQVSKMMTTSIVTDSA